MLVCSVQGGTLEVKKRHLPKLRAGWPLVRVRLAGICNTDLEILRGYHGFGGTAGHEFVVEDAEAQGVSAATKREWLGRRVWGGNNQSCSARWRKKGQGFRLRRVRTD